MKKKTRKQAASEFRKGSAQPQSARKLPKPGPRQRLADLQLFRRMAENAKDMIYRMSLPDGNYEYVNPASVEITGYTPEELYGNPLLVKRIIHPDWHGYFDRQWQDLLKGEVPPSYEYVIVHKSGEEKWINQRNVLVRDSEGKPAAIEGILTDITRRKQYEKMLHLSEERFKAQYHGSPFPTFTWQRVGDEFLLVDCNTAAHLATQGDARLYLNKAARDMYKDQPEILCDLRQCFENKAVLRRELRSVHFAPDRLLAVTYVFVPEDFVMVQVDDITARREAEERLGSLNRRLENIIEFLPDATMIIDSEKRIIAWNRAIEEMTGVPKEEILGKDHLEAAVPFYGKPVPFLMDYIGGEEPMCLPRYENIRREADTLNAEAFAPALYRGGGAYIWAIAAPLYDSDGNAIGVIESIRDITEQRRSAEEKRKLETQLIQAQKMESIGTLAGGIAHDFNNILSAIFGFCELALEDISDPEKAKSAIQEVLKASDRAKWLVSQILTFSRKTEISYAPLALRAVVKESVRMLRSMLPSTIEIRQDLADSGLVLSDSTQLHQILMNLSTNAAQAMNKKGGVLDISLQRVNVEGPFARDLDVAPGNYLKLTVSDTGDGIPPELLERIFEPYFTTKEPGRGTGLGLSVVHGIVKSHKGAIACRSSVGNGTTFDVYLPEIDSEGSPPAPPPKEPLPTGRERILFIDDELMLADLAEKMLSRLGYQMTIMTSSVEAFDYFKQRPDEFDLVITDMTMPVMTGDMVAQKIMQVRPDIPVILCSGYSEHISEEKAKEIGVRAFLPKPLEIRELTKTIRSVLNAK